MIIFIQSAISTLVLGASKLSYSYKDIYSINRNSSKISLPVAKITPFRKGTMTHQALFYSSIKAFVLTLLLFRWPYVSNYLSHPFYKTFTSCSCTISLKIPRKTQILWNKYVLWKDYFPFRFLISQVSL